MQPGIEQAIERKLVGQRMIMSLAINRTGELWSNFMARRSEIKDSILSPVYSVQIYPPSYFENFLPTNVFEKWAAIEVSELGPIPDQMETLVLTTGLYAVFPYKGLSTSSSIFEYVFTSWLPTSNYVLDNRPHFEVLGKKYKNNDPESEEEIWIPIRQRE